jgi:hypothetical protein
METKKQNNETKVQAIQRQILDGRKVVIISNEKTLTLVKIINNNIDTDGSKKWLIIINKEEYYTSEIKINCFSSTFSEKLDNFTEKNSIVCVAKEIIFENNVATIH